MAENFEITQKKIMYMTNLLSETLPLDLLTKETLKSFDMDPSHSYCLIHLAFGNKLKETIESKNEQNVAQWKSLLHEKMLSPLRTKLSKDICLLNMAPYTRTLIFSYVGKDIDQLKTIINDWFDQVIAYVDEEQIGSFIAFANPRIRELKDIGIDYKKLRYLMDYRYTIGMGKLVFYDEFDVEASYSITEYKYLQRFETLLSIDDFTGLTTIVSEINKHIKRHLINDSKVLYMYKELMAITIRHLYSKETLYLNEIANLNLSINNFEAHFDDIEAVTSYLRQTFANLQNKGDSLHNDYHPHIKKVLRIVEQNYMENIGLGDIAIDLKLSLAYLSRLFKGEIGLGFKDYLTKYRLNIIKDLLEHSSKSIIEIAQLSGYNNPNQLTRIFKKI